MADVPGPTVPPEDENRHLHCQMAVDLPLQDIIESAVSAGWREEEVLSAMTEVLDNLMLAHINNSELSALLAAMKRNKE
jgi:hypothetical protein